jgi:uncharacterized repeat protein (TIGR01451 family)
MRTQANGGALLAALLVVLAVTAPVAGQQAEPLVVAVENLTAAADSARAQRASGEALPNDVLRYTLTFTNPEGRELRNVVFTNPIPGGLVLVAGSVNTSAPASVAYSIDGGATYAEQPIVTVTENGRTVRRPADPSSYTHIRWTVTADVAPNARVTAEYQVRVGVRPL